MVGRKGGGIVRWCEHRSKLGGPERDRIEKTEKEEGGLETHRGKRERKHNLLSFVPLFIRLREGKFKI